MRKPLRPQRTRPNLAAEALECRLLLASSVRLAMIGDYAPDGNGYAGEQAVANLVKSWNPALVVTLGDSNTPDGAASTIDANIGQFYHPFVSPYSGSYGAGSADGVNHFWPSLGNHDWLTPGAQPYLNYFTLPGNERYYTVQQGNVQIFIVDSDPNEPDGNTATSVQGKWLQSELAKSTARWKLVAFHHPPYTSGSNGAAAWMRWPFAAWGATAVFSGHDHDYERLVENGITYFVDGLGGAPIVDFAATDPGSKIRFNADHGALLIDASDTTLTTQFITSTGTLVDSYTFTATTTAPAAPTNLAAAPVSQSQIRLTWTDQSSNETGFKIYRSPDGITFSQIATAGPDVTTYTDTQLPAATSFTYYVRATHSAGDSAPSNTAAATTQSTTTVTTYLSDLTWLSATNGWGPVEKNTSNGSSGAGDGRTITLNGVTFAKGIGCHANSQIVYNLGGKYSSFLADVGIDDEKSQGSIVFQVLADGVKLYDSGVMYATTATKNVALSVAGAQQLTLVVTDAGDGIDNDHADWAGARLLSYTTPTAPAAPTNLLGAAVSLTRVNLSWTDNSNDETGFKIERSTDGATFSQIGTTPANVASFADATAGSALYYYRVRAGNAAGDSAYSNTASVTTPAAMITTYLSDLTWISATNGWGPVEKDTSNGSSGTRDGHTITLNGVTYAKGIGCHANSQIVYNLAGAYSTFLSDVGIDDEKSQGSVIFQVLADGVKVYDSGVMYATTATKSITLNVTGVKQLTLIVNDAGDGIDCDHAEWAGARLLRPSVTAQTTAAAVNAATETKSRKALLT